MKKILNASLLVLSLAAIPALASHPSRQVNPNDDLIYAVKGLKSAYALLAGMLNPLAGLMVAAYNPSEGKKDLVNIDKALANGAYINYQEEHTGYTALIYAAYKGYPSIAKHLLSKGADARIKEDDGYNAYTMALYYLQDYKERLQDNEASEQDHKKRARMRAYYQDFINRYQELVNMLAPITADKAMPKSGW